MYAVVTREGGEEGRRTAHEAGGDKRGIDQERAERLTKCAVAVAAAVDGRIRRAPNAAAIVTVVATSCFPAP